MKRLSVFCVCLLVVASAQAVTIRWNVPNSSSNVGGWYNPSNTGFAVYLVASVNPLENAGQLVSYLTGIQSDVPSLLKGVLAQSANGKIDTSNILLKGIGTVTLSTPTSGKSATMSANITLPVIGTNYSMLFVSTDADGNAQYIASNSVKYTLTGANGFYATEAAANADVGNYIDLGWMVGGTWGAPRAVPEPSTFTLLALGVASLVLRRRKA